MAEEKPRKREIKLRTDHPNVNLVTEPLSYHIQFIHEKGMSYVYKLTDGMANQYDINKFITDYEYLDKLLIPENIFSRTYNNISAQDYHYYDEKNEIFISSSYDIRYVKDEYQMDLEQIAIYANLDNKETLSLLDDMQEQFLKSRKEADVEHTIKLIVQGEQGLVTRTHVINNVPELDFNYYNEGFEDFHRNCKADIESNKGLTLLHGTPGTGKTTYIKMLTKEVDRKFIFVPPSMSASLADPGLIPLLLSNPNCVLVIEDAEDCLIARDGGGHKAAVSNILNMTDGILSDILNIHVIATFNTDISRVDEALQRPGRLRNSYEFKALSPDRVQALTGEEAKESMTIATLMNGEVEFKKENRKKVGF